VSALIDDPAQVAAIAAGISGAPIVAFDLEFLSADRLVPALCLVQVAWLDAAPEPIVALLDPIAVDVAPVVHALARHTCAVAHAPRQDLALLASRFGVAMPAVVDTQLMAAFAGIGEQVGFATLANELLGIALDKDQQWTDWSARPLSAAQMAYAEADVVHLPEVYARLAARLGDRLAWAREESSRVAADAVAAASVTADTAWRQISLRGLEPIAAATAIALAAWRFRVAAELDRPLGQVLNEKALLELARERPDEPGEVRAVKGLSDIARKRAPEIVEAIGRAKLEDAPPPPLASATSPRAQRWADMLFAIVQVVAEQIGVAPRLLATRADAEEAARAVDERGVDALASLPACATWRRDVLGVVWDGWLRGSVAITGDAASRHGIKVGSSRA
jgi:ribonuclease D